MINSVVLVGRLTKDIELNKEYFDIAINRIKESEENKKGELW